jgi:hypothetical protein
MSSIELAKQKVNSDFPSISISDQTEGLSSVTQMPLANQWLGSRASFKCWTQINGWAAGRHSNADRKSMAGQQGVTQMPDVM